MSTLYEVLGIPAKAPQGEVKTAYRRLARTYHPDLNPDPKAHETMAKINAAFEVLSDPVRRMEYDVSIGGQGVVEPFGDWSGAVTPEAVKVTLTNRVRGHRTPIYGMAYSPESQKLATCSFDNEVYWWDSNVSETESRVRLEGGVVSTMVATGPYQAVVAGCSEQQVTCWRINGGHQHSWRQNPNAWAVGVAIAPDGASLAVGSNDRSARILSTRDGAEVQDLCGHKDTVTSLAWSADSQILATGSSDATVKVWNAKTGALLHTFVQVRSAVTALAFSPDGRWLAVAAVDFSIRVFHLGQMRLRKTFFGHQRPIEAMAFHPRSWLLASCSRDGSFGLWNVVEGIGHGRIDASVQPLLALAFHPNGVEMATGGLDKVLRVWRLSSPKSGR